jgi:hypothetical protein
MARDVIKQNPSRAGRPPATKKRPHNAAIHNNTLTPPRPFQLIVKSVTASESTPLINLSNPQNELLSKGVMGTNPTGQELCPTGSRGEGCQRSADLPRRQVLQVHHMELPHHGVQRRKGKADCGPNCFER